MNTDSEELFYLGAGPLLAVLLGIGLVPVRHLTIASNFTFLFLALIIVVAEFGGRRPALATAVAATLSLDFFLTEPYLRLEIAGKHDIIAFFGLAGCGLLVAWLAAPRRRPRSRTGTGEGNLRPGP
jgi:K+-sensing histidine kinase KdpD